MKNKSVKDIILRTLSAVLAVTTVSIAVIGWNGINCITKAEMDAAFARHPESSPKQISTDSYVFMYNTAMQIAQQQAAQIGGYVIDPGLENVIISDCTRRIGVYQGYINSLQVQYQNAMATGNVAYAQQCLNLINAWNAKITETNNYLTAYKLSIGR